MAKLSITINPIEAIDAKRLVARLIATGVPVESIQWGNKRAEADKALDILKDN